MSTSGEHEMAIDTDSRTRPPGVTSPLLAN
jgi:hypothetical protein